MANSDKSLIYLPRTAKRGCGSRPTYYPTGIERVPIPPAQGPEEPKQPDSADVTPKTAYQEIMQTVADTDSLSVTTVADLEMKIKKSKEEVRKQKERAEWAESATRSCQLMYVSQCAKVWSANEEKAVLQKGLEEHKAKIGGIANRCQQEATPGDQ